MGPYKAPSYGIMIKRLHHAADEKAITVEFGLRYWNVYMPQRQLPRSHSAGVRLTRMPIRVCGENSPKFAEERFVLAVDLPQLSAEVSESFEISLSDDLSRIEKNDRRLDKFFYQKHDLTFSCAGQPGGFTYFLARIILMFQTAETAWTRVLDVLDEFSFFSVRNICLSLEPKHIHFYRR